MNMTREDCESFAAQWAEAWNRRDVESVLAHFDEEIVFTSPTALAVTGNAIVHGKTALRDYWLMALSRTNSLRFSVDYVSWDCVRLELAIIYISEIDGQGKRVSENLRFNEVGLVIEAEVFHGVLV